MKIKELKISIDIFALIDFIKRLRKRRVNVFNGHKYALPKDKKDSRDIIYKARRYAIAPASTNKENIAAFKARYDQGQLGSCTANASCAAYRRTLQVNSLPDFDMSRLFQYYNSRTDKSEDTGASIRDAFKAMNRYGVCSEGSWPYKANNFKTQPPNYCYEEGKDHQSILYEKIYPITQDAIKDAIAGNRPAVCGIPIYESFETAEVARTGRVPMPRCGDKLLGYHAVAYFDYDEEGVYFLNSWGIGWGMDGVGFLPWKYVMRYTSDPWVLFSVE